jgi:hypothetical protein
METSLVGQKKPPRSRVLEKLAIALLVKEFTELYESYGSLLCSQEPATGHHPETEESDLCQCTPIFPGSIVTCLSLTSNLFLATCPAHLIVNSN